MITCNSDVIKLRGRIGERVLAKRRRPSRRA
jgi:hypothetical protein